MRPVAPPARYDAGMTSPSKPAIKAAFMSGLLFPGMGQFSLRRPVRGCLFLLPAVLAVLYLLQRVLALASQLLAELQAGTLALDPLLILERVHASGIDDPAANGAALVLLLCWIGAVADALWPQRGA
jgi:hypothetical protein